jgi:hypothetical protein
VSRTRRVTSHYAHFARVVHPTPAAIRRAMAEVDSVNAKIAVLITKLVGSMYCAYLFAVLALAGLPAALKPGGEGLVAWIAQTFLQLVLLSVIMVGQAVQSLAADERAAQTLADAEAVKAGQEAANELLAEIKTSLDAVSRALSRIADSLSAHPPSKEPR